MNKIRGTGTPLTADTIGKKTPESITQPADSESPGGWSMATSAKLAAAIGLTGGGLLLHFIGATGHRVYLNAMNIDAGLFPKPTDWTIITGYYLSVDRFTAIISFLAANAWIALLGTLVVTIYVFVTQQMGKLTERKLKAVTPPAWLRSWVGDFARLLMLTSIVSLAIPIAIALLVLSMITIAAFAETAGLSAAQRDLAQFQKGCGNASATSKCYEIHKGGALLARGFLIESTDAHIAIFDVDKQRARALEREGTELLGQVVPAQTK